jgi:hypothetical protein
MVMHPNWGCLGRLDRGIQVRPCCRPAADGLLPTVRTGRRPRRSSRCAFARPAGEEDASWWSRRAPVGLPGSVPTTSRIERELFGPSSTVESNGSSPVAGRASAAAAAAQRRAAARGSGNAVVGRDEHGQLRQWHQCIHLGEKLLSPSGFTTSLTVAGGQRHSTLQPSPFDHLPRRCSLSITARCGEDFADILLK